MIDQLILDSCDPDQSVVVEACAGSGKTWLLVSRIIRLLLAGAKPSEILAITFTRKAAQEMRGRLDQVLLQFANCPEEELIKELNLKKEYLTKNEVCQIYKISPTIRVFFWSRDSAKHY